MSQILKKRSSRYAIIFTFIVLLVVTLIITIHALCVEGNTNDAPSTPVVPRPASESSCMSATTSLAAQMEAPKSPETEKVVELWTPDRADVEYIAKTLYGECRGVKSDTEKAAVAWCILNRVDATGYACGQSVEYVVTFKNQFKGYSPDHPVTRELEQLAIDVLMRWHAEKEGEQNVGRVLPAGYIYFVGDGKHNYFTEEYLGKSYWDFSMASPYEN